LAGQRCADHAYQISQQALLTILQGNHDYTNQDNPFFEFLNRMENVSWISTPTTEGANESSMPKLGHQRHDLKQRSFA
jgi:hypothetical protein